MSLYKKINIPYTNFFLIRWNPRILTRIHNHNNKNCNFIVLRGALEESIYKSLPTGYYMVDNKILYPNQASMINDEIGEHSIKNLSDSYSWSLHYYK